MAKHKSTGTPATSVLDALKLPYTLHPYHHDDASTDYGREAAAALGIEPGRIFKTLLVDVGDQFVTAVVPVANMLNLKAIAAAAGAKRATMAEPHAAERVTGMVVGGISPLGHKQRHRTFLDGSAAAYPTIFVSAGRRGLQVELDPAHLLGALNAAYADLAR